MTYQIFKISFSEHRVDPHPDDRDEVVSWPEGDGHGIRGRGIRRRRLGLQPDPDGHRQPEQRRGKDDLSLYFTLLLCPQPRALKL